MTTWQMYEQSIYDILLPELHKIQEVLSNTVHNGESHAQLDVSKWQTRSTLEKLKKLFRDIAAAQQSIYESDLIFCNEKILDEINAFTIESIRIWTKRN